MAAQRGGAGSEKKRGYGNDPVFFPVIFSAEYQKSKQVL
jgi:hypothetical protein